MIPTIFPAVVHAQLAINPKWRIPICIGINLPTLLLKLPLKMPLKRSSNTSHIPNTVFQAATSRPSPQCKMIAMVKNFLYRPLHTYLDGSGNVSILLLVFKQ